MASRADFVLQERHGHVLVLTMNRPQRHHALNRALASRLVAAMNAAAEDEGIRVVVLTGSGEEAFCAGADMQEASGVEVPATDPRMGTVADAIDTCSRTPIPVIAAINGYCYGGGARLAIGCDIRLASVNATFRLPGAEYGLVVAAATLPRLVGASKAKELIFTGRKFDADEALKWGLLSSVHELQELMPAALDMAQQIAANSVAAVRASKAVIDAATLSDAAADLEQEKSRRLRGSPEQVARFRAATKEVTGR